MENAIIYREITPFAFRRKGIINHIFPVVHRNSEGTGSSR